MSRMLELLVLKASIATTRTVYRLLLSAGKMVEMFLGAYLSASGIVGVTSVHNPVPPYSRYCTL